MSEATPDTERAATGLAPDVQYAGFWIRLAAYFADALLQGALIAGAVVLLGLIGVETALSGVLVLLILAVLIAYFPVSWTLLRGQTPGMMAFDLRIVRERDGSPIGLGTALVRFLGWIVSAVVLDLGFLAIGIDRRKRGWHDRIAGTVVVRPTGASLDRLTDLAIAGFLWGLRLAVVAVVVVGSFLTLTSGKYQTETWADLISFGLVLGSIYALIALGYTMVYGILRMINFAHGEIFMCGAFGGYFTATALGQSGFLHQGPVNALISVAIIMLVAATVSTSVALLVERIAYRPLRAAPRLVPLISAIGASFFLQYSVKGLFGPGVYAYPDVAVLKELAPVPIFHFRWMDLLVILAAVAMMAGLYLFVMRTKIGTAIRAVSEDKATAALMGIDVNRAIVTTFAVGAAMAGAAGALYGLKFSTINFFSGFYPGIKAFTAAVLGGIGNVPGAMLGGLLLGQVESLGPTLFLDGLEVPAPNQLKDAIAFIMLVMVLIFRPSGLLGERITGQRT